MDDNTKRQLSPFLKSALDKEASDRNFLEKLAVGIYEPMIKADEDTNKPAAI